MALELLHDLGYFGHYLHMHAGGRGGKQFVLTSLHKSGGKLTQQDLLEHTNISPAALSEVLSKLEVEGLIVREPYKHDRRRLLIELTEKGHECAARMRQKREQFERQAFSCLTPEERTELGELLSRVRQHWETLEEKEVDA